MNFGVGQIGLAVSLLVCVSCASAVVVTLSDGTRLRGTENGGVASFKGIAFAAPPVGPLRWTPPQPWVNPAPAEIVDATQFGSPCKQTRDGEVLGDEDCLFLNVYVNLEKAGADSGRHITPVGLYIHGGSYINGAGSDYDGSDFVNFWNGSVIVVSTNYRLNVFGFSGSDELRVQDSIAGSTANYGLQDQRQAMEWIKSNIGSFGGDSSALTIYGESAGAGSITNHLVMNKSWGLFSSAILESGSFSEWVTQNMSLAQGAYEKLVESVNCSTAFADEQLECMLQTSSDAIYEASLEIASLDIAYGTPYNPTADGVELGTHPWIALSRGDLADVPILHGTNTDEGTMFFPLPEDVGEAGLVSYWKSFDYSDFEIRQMLGLYVTGKVYPEVPVEAGQAQPSVYWWAGQRMLGDVVFSCPSKYTSEQLSLLQKASKRRSPVYFYHFEYAADGSAVPYVQHTAEIPFIFHMNEEMASRDDKEMSDIMSLYWGNFIIHHNPNAVDCSHTNLRGRWKTDGKLPLWPAYDVYTDEIVYLYDSKTIGTTTGLKDAECRFENPRTAASIREAFINS